jgi:prepilin-type N-terminal cleavage/methylation domain-containing protein
MLNNIKKRKQEGFTIIEVLIVLAIAGLILLVVFLAVPALQRNSRNTQMKNAAASVLGAVSEYTNNNGGTQPDTAAIAADGTVTISAAAGSDTPAKAKIQSGYAVAAGSTMPTATGSFVVYFGHKCTNATTFDTASTPRAVAIGYKIEANGTTANQCTDS